MIKLELLGDPISNNALYKATNRGKFTSVYMTKDGKRLKESYSKQALKQYSGNILSYELYIEIDLYFGNKRRHDYDNYGKILNDSLTGIIWEDDSQIRHCGKIKKHYDKNNPRIEILIEKYKDKNTC